MYVDSSKTKINGKTYERHLLRESYREDGRVKHRTIANLSRCSPEELEAIRLALRHKSELAELLSGQDASALLQPGGSNAALAARQGLSVGAVWLVYDMARQLGIERALGPSRQGRLALWQVIARVLDQGSRLSAVRLATSHAACDALGLDAFNEDDLYGNLDWLCEKQAVIEKRLFESRGASKGGGLFLYDVTSSYLEGTENELAAFGYNRDGKRGKKQIVIGLLCDGEGEPVSVEVFRGNTQDAQTFAPQVAKAAERFGARDVTFVGDRGMIKSRQIEALGEFAEKGFHYITAITKPQIETLLKAGAIQLSLFDSEVAEVSTDEGVRYILRRNPVRAMETEASRQDKLASLQKVAAGRNAYLREHARASVEVARRVAQERAEKLRIAQWVRVSADEEGRRIALDVDEAALAEAAKLDGCYVLKTDLDRAVADAERVHGRYKDLAQVEWAFRTSKTVELELRPIHVRLASRTRGHVFIVTLAYRIARALARRWGGLDTTVQEGIDELKTLCATEILQNGRALCSQIPQPRPSVRALLDAAGVRLPEVLPSKGTRVATKRKLPSRRKER
jgi:hypothetical protein